MAATARDRSKRLAIQHMIGGESVDSQDGRTFESLDPHDNRVFADVSLGGTADVDRAVTAARRAFDEGPWPRMSTAERGRLLHALADAVESHGEELAFLEARDIGRPLSEVLERDVPRSAMNLRFFADLAVGTEEEALSSHGAEMKIRYESAGVVAAISPWNFPLMLETWKIAPALAFGNTVVLKPAEQSPATAARLGELAREAGLPDGVLNVVHGYGPDSAGEALTRHSGIDRITFTGETATGRAIMTAAAQNLVPVSFEMGGKSANIVFADADLEVAVRETARGVFWNTGQVCVAGSRLYVQEDIYDDFLDKLAATARAMRIGDPLEPETRMGPLVSSDQRDRVESFVKQAATEARVVLETGRPQQPELTRGNYFGPAIFADVPPTSRCMREEIFGPVLSAAPFRDDDEAIRLANDTPYGLAAMLFTRDEHRADRTAAALRCGNVWVNCFFHRDLRAPFGGVGDSGIGREGGLHSREFFTEPKAISYAH